MIIIIALGVLCLIFFIENARELRTFRISDLSDIFP